SGNLWLLDYREGFRDGDVSGAFFFPGLLLLDVDEARQAPVLPAPFSAREKASNSAGICSIRKSTNAEGAALSTVSFNSRSPRRACPIFCPDADRIARPCSRDAAVRLCSLRSAAAKTARNRASDGESRNRSSAIAAWTRFSAPPSLKSSANDCQRPRPTFGALPMA